MKSKTLPWTAFPYADPAYDYGGARLRESWGVLHRGDREPYPEAERLEELAGQAEGEVLSIPAHQAASLLQDGWRAYHRGAFADAVEAGLAVGPLGHILANKAANIYATYLEPDKERRLILFKDSAARAEALAGRLPHLANAWYFGAQALGRYGQEISVAKALAAGLGGKVRDWLGKVLVLDEAHADAHIVLGAFQAEVVVKMGVFAAALSYGASKDKAVRHFERALALDPGSAIARIEYARALRLLYGAAREGTAAQLLREAAACQARDAMDRLDIELAREDDRAG